LKYPSSDAATIGKYEFEIISGIAIVRSDSIMVPWVFDGANAAVQQRGF
jgi:hypothetical protein